MIDINLLPQEKEPTIPAPKAPREKEKVQIESESYFPTKSFMTSFLLIILVAGLTFGLFIYKNTRASFLEQTERKITVLKEEEKKYKEVESKAKNLQAQLNNLDNVLSKHKYWSAVLTALSNFTPQDVQYQSIICEEKNNKFTVTGFANNYESLASLMVSLKNAVKNEQKEKIFDSIDLESAKLGFNEAKEIKVEFSITFNLQPGALKKVQYSEVKEESEKEEAKEEAKEENVVRILRHSDGYAYWEPLELKIKQGQKVKWVNEDQEAHEVKSVNDLFDSGEIKPGKSWEYKFEEKGNFEYFCPMHSKIDSPYQKPKIIVE